MLLLKMGPEVPSRARRALPALRRSEKEGVCRTPEPSRYMKFVVWGVIKRKHGRELFVNIGRCFLTIGYRLLLSP